MKNVIIVGAGAAGEELLQELKKHSNLDINVAAFLDDDPKKQGKKILGVPVVGKTTDLESAIKSQDIEEVFIAIPSTKGATIRKIVDSCKDLKVVFKIVPRTLDIVQGKVSITSVKDVDVSDLIGRELLQLEQHPFIDFFKGKKVLVTGACGSIGSEICRQLAVFSPAEIIFYDWWENGMFELNEEFKTKFPKVKIVTVIGDIKDSQRVDNIFQNYHPDIVFHAAAYKHVPLMEENPSEAAKNNVLGTKIIAEAANKYNISHFVFISTDKAINPKSIMGATKLIAEGIIHEISKNSSTKFISVRFGNVLDSFGSVVPLFRKQIAQGGPVTVTHKDVKRFFMSIPEAVQLIFQAAMLGKGGEIFILDMGEPIKIIDLAKILIELSGFIPDKDIKIEYTGLRPGEKLEEELFTKEEDVAKTKNERIFVTKNFGLNMKNLYNSLDILLERAKDYDDQGVRKEIRNMVPNFQT